MKSIIRNPYLIFFSILLLFFIHRSFTFLFLFNKILRVECTEWNSVKLAYDIFYGAADLLSVLKTPSLLFKYTDVICNGGILLDSILYLPVAFVFGINLYSIKILPLIFSAATLSIGMVFLYRRFSLTAMVCYGLLYVFASPIFIRWSMTFYQPTGSANHLFVLLSLFLYLKISQIKFFRIRKYYTAMFSLWSALMLFYQYTFVIVIVAVFFDLIIRCSRDCFFKELGLFTAFFIIGCFPFFINFFIVNDFYTYVLPMLKIDFASYNIIWDVNPNNQNFFAYVSDFLRRITQCVLFFPKFSPMWGSPVLLFFCNMLYKFLLLFAMLKIFQKYKSYYIFCVYIIAYYLVVSMASKSFSVYRYWLSLYPVIYLLIAILISVRYEEKHSKIWCCFFIILMSFGVFDTLKSFTYAHDMNFISKFQALQYYLNNDISNVDEENIDDVHLFLKTNGLWVDEDMAYAFTEQKNYLLLKGFGLIFEPLNPNYPYLYNGLVPFSQENIDIKNFEYNLKAELSTLSNHALFFEGLGWGLGIKYRWNREKVVEFCLQVSSLEVYMDSIISGYERGEKLRAK